MLSQGTLANNEVVIVSAGRTPFGKFGGTLQGVPSPDLGAHVVREVLRRVALPAEAVEELYYGCAIPVETGTPVAAVVARQVLLKAGLPPSTVSLTVDRACCSSMSAIHLGYRAIRSGQAEVVVAAGAENMGRAPHVLYDLRWGRHMGHVTVQDPLWAMGYDDYNPVSVDAGQVAVEYGVSREEQDEWAYGSQCRYAAALAAGKFTDEIMPLEVPAEKGQPVLFSEDEFPRPDTTLEKLASLRTVYGSPTVTAGNAPGINAGASAVLLTSARIAAERGLEPLARIVGVASFCMEPRMIAAVPGHAILRALGQVNLSLDEMSLIEINEAFAAVPLVSSEIMAGGDTTLRASLRDKINVNSGAIALGHPLGATGARLVLTLAYELRRRGGGYGVAAICGGLAQGDAVVIHA